MEYAASISPRVAMRYWWRRFALCVLMLPAWAVCTPALAVAAGAAALHLPASWDGKLPGADGTLMPWEFIKSAHADWLRDGKITIVATYTRHGIPGRPDVHSVFELAQTEKIPGIKEEIKRDFGFEPDFEGGKHYLEANDSAGNTFKATAKPVLIGTAVVGATKPHSQGLVRE